MDEGQNELQKTSSTQSPRKPSIQTQNNPQTSPLTIINSGKLGSIQNSKISSLMSPVHNSPLNTISPSSAKELVNALLKNEKSPDRESLENKGLQSNVETFEINTSQPFSEPKLYKKTDVQLSDASQGFSKDIIESQTPVLQSNINKIANMGKILTNEANSLKESIKSLSENIIRTKQELNIVKENVNFPYHLFLIEMIINKIYMKCDCFELDCNNLVITATFLGKQPITLYDPSYGKVDDFNCINVGKSALFAMTYDKICGIQEFFINIQLTKQPPCSKCVSKIAECEIDYTKEFSELRVELCKKWAAEQPNDNIVCTTSTPLAKNMFYLSCGDSYNTDSIGIIELTTRMSFLGKEITTAFGTQSKPKCTSVLMKEDNGMTMYSCQNVEMDGEGKILLEENSYNKKELQRSAHTMSAKRSESPESQLSSGCYSMKHNNWRMNNNNQAGLGEFRIRDLNDEINKLMREKRHWEVQIKTLGGPDHARVGPKMLDQDGKEVPGNRGYKYFGAAKDLPGVRELFEQEPPTAPRRTRADLMRDVDADYYGYRDDDDGLLLPLEKEAEEDAIARAVDEWKRKKQENKDQDLPEEENIYPEDPNDRRLEEDDDVNKPAALTSHVAVPSQKDVEDALLRRKKQELLERYGCLDVKMES